MIRINLLPEEFHVHKKKFRISPHWGFFVAGVVIIFTAMLLLTLWQRSRLSRLESDIRRTRVEAERQKADLALVQELTALKERILQRMQVVEQLNQNRTRWIDILTDLSTAIPEDMWLTTFKEEQNIGNPRVRIQGMTFTLKPVALFIDRLAESGTFGQPQFSYAQRIPVREGMAYDFEIQSGLSAPQTATLEKKTSPAGDAKQGKK